VATDVRQIVADLVGFYDFTDKVVVDVGAGGGQLVEYARTARRVIAVDRDEAAIERLAARLHECGLADRFTLIQDDFLSVRTAGDVVLFEFCLHEMAEPERALGHAGELARDVLVIDHAPSSRWSWYAAEDDDVKAAWRVVERAAIRRRQEVGAFQHFQEFAELEAKLASRGPTSLERIVRHRGDKNISIPMPYRMALL
jgi:predicted RNA methylase